MSFFLICKIIGMMFSIIALISYDVLIKTINSVAYSNQCCLTFLDGRRQQILCRWEQSMTLWVETFLTFCQHPEVTQNPLCPLDFNCFCQYLPLSSKGFLTLHLCIHMWCIFLIRMSVILD
jgi:hypothetical protein